MTLREQYIQNNPAGLEWDKWLEAELFKQLKKQEMPKSGFELFEQMKERIERESEKATPKEGK